MTARCPDENDLLALVSGKLSRLVALPLQSHIERCESCRTAVVAAVRSVSQPSVTAETSRRLGVGSVLDGRFELVKVIGQGGSGIVWSAFPVGETSLVAIKLLRNPSADQIARLTQREVRLSLRIEHPAFLPIREVLMHAPDQPALVMELLNGRDLDTHLKERGVLSVPDALDILVPLTDALVALHALKIAHRDLKPANLFIEQAANGTARLRILDLGLARSFDFERGTLSSAPLTSAGMLMGTPLYMAPEQLEASPDIDTRADIWALGAIAYRLLSGKNHIQVATQAEAWRELYCQPIPELSQLVPSLPGALTQLIHRSLQVRPSDRPSAEHWAVQLERLRVDEGA